MHIMFQVVVYLLLTLDDVDRVSVSTVMRTEMRTLTDSGMNVKQIGEPLS